MSVIARRVNWYAVPPAIAIVLILVFGAARLVDAAGHVDYEHQAESMGPIVPGSFHIIAQSSVPGGTAVVYTVRRPGRQGVALGIMHTATSFPFGRHVVSGGESSGGQPINHMETSASVENGLTILYGRVLESGAVAVEMRTAGGTELRARVQPGGGFVLATRAGLSPGTLHVITRHTAA